MSELDRRPSDPPLAEPLDVFGCVLAGVNRMLPRAPSRRTGRRRGAESQSPLSPSLLTRLGDRAAHQYNQLAPEEGHTT